MCIEQSVCFKNEIYLYGKKEGTLHFLSRSQNRFPDICIFLLRILSIYLSNKGILSMVMKQLVKNTLHFMKYSIYIVLLKMYFANYQVN